MITISSPTDNEAAPKMQESLAGLPVVPLTEGTIITAERADRSCAALLTLAAGADSRSLCEFQLICGQTGIPVRAGFSSHGQRFHFSLTSSQVELLATSGMRVKLEEGVPPLWVVAGDSSRTPLAPALFQKKDMTPYQNFLTELQTNCLCQFSWMGGCVLEALDLWYQSTGETVWKSAANQWLDHFLTADGFHYQKPNGAPLTDTVYGIEGTLPMASIVRHRNTHPCLDTAVDFWLNHVEDDGAVYDGKMFSAESCYTVAYPMMAVGVDRNNRQLIQQAETQLRLARKRLCIDGDLYLRNQRGNLSFRNWARGIAWYLLGHVNSLIASGNSDAFPDIKEHLAERLDWVVTYQRTDGLWDNFLNEPGRPPDSSGSAGISAAILLASRHHLISNRHDQAAVRCFETLKKLLLPNGWITSVAPNNKKGEDYQHLEHRTSEPFAMGLLGQLAAMI